MVELQASFLMSHDEFTVDQGETWHKIKVVRDAKRGTRIVVITTNDREFIFKSDDLIITK